ncbi:hypothetical protein BH18ACT4_BH18ACT4_10600 [soil metagenome]
MHLVDDLDGYLRGDAEFSGHEHDVLVHALNEGFAERDLNHPLSYSHA